MSVLMNASIRVDKLPKEKFIKGKDGAVYYNMTISVSDENDCPPGTLWCEQHEECEDEKDWKTHNRVLTPEEIENQKQFQTSGKLSDK